MKTLHTTVILAAALLPLLALGVADARAQTEFTFEGYARYLGPADAVGSELEILGIANPAVSAPLPLPLDFAAREYTLYARGLTVVHSHLDAGNAVLTVSFAGGELTVHADDRTGGTAAAWGDDASFTDGDAILHGTLDDGWTMQLDDPLGQGIWSGAGFGTFAFDGGSRLAELLGAGYLAGGWAMAGTGISDPRPPFFTVPAGFARVFGVKLVFPFDPTGSAAATWGGVKNLYR